MDAQEEKKYVLTFTIEIGSEGSHLDVVLPPNQKRYFRREEPLSLIAWTQEIDKHCLFTFEQAQEILARFVLAPSLRGEYTWGWNKVKIEEAP